MWPVLEQLWYFNYPGGLAVDSKGYIYIADRFNYRIQKFSLDGKFVTRWGKSGNQNGEFNMPDEVAVDSKNFVYVLEKNYNRVQKFDSNGQFICSWDNADNANQLNHPESIAISSDDFVYVADTRNNRIIKYSSNGFFLNKWGEEGKEIGDFNTPMGMCADISGNIYVADKTNNRIQTILRNGDIRIFTVIQSGWKDPSYICVDSNGNLYVLVLIDNDSFTDYQVLKYNTNGLLIAQWENKKNSESFFQMPLGIISDKKGSIYISDTINHAIIKFTENGDFCVRWDPSGSVNGRFNFPSSVDVDNNGNIYVADNYNHRIQVFNSIGEFQFFWGGEGQNPGQMKYPTTIVADNNDPDNTFLYVSEKANKRIQKFDSQGNLISEFIDNVDSSGIAVDSESNVYLTDMIQNQVLICSSEGEIITQWGQMGKAPGEFYNPRGIAVYNHNVFVVDTSNSRIQKFTKSGNFLTQWGNNDNETVKYLPTGIAINKNGQIFVTDMDGFRIQVYDSDGNFITQFCEGGNLSGNLYDPLCLAFGPDELIYVADTFNHRIQVFDYSISEPDKKNQKLVSNENKAFAIIVSGGGNYPGNDLWDATQYNANFAYQILSYNEFSKDQILYLSENIYLDLDGNTKFDDVDLLPTNENLNNAIIQNPKDSTQLFIYLIDHGGKYAFRMNRHENLSVEMLDEYLDKLQERQPVQVTIIYDACQSGSFMSALKPTIDQKRIIITSTSLEQSAYFLMRGSISFSTSFWTEIYYGNDIFNAFHQASLSLKQANIIQHPCIDDNGDGLYTDADGAFASQIQIGKSHVTYGDPPLILHVSASQILPQGTNSATIAAYSITDTDGIARVFAYIQPPHFKAETLDNPVQGFPSIELFPIDNTIYEGHYNHFNSEGTYQVMIYALDRFGNLSMPKITTVTVQETMLKKAMIISGSPGITIHQEAIDYNTDLAYQALLIQGYSDDSIYSMASHHGNMVDNYATRENIENAIKNWASENASDLVLYLTGNGHTHFFDVNPQELLSAFELDTWLDDLQNQLSGYLSIIIDSSQSGHFMSELKSTDNQKRIIICSTSENQNALFLAKGLISFSGFFWPQIQNGINIRDAFLHAAESIDFPCNIQTPQLNDNGNETANESDDGILSLNQKIGSGIQFASNAPSAGIVNESNNISPTTAIVNIHNASGVSNIQKAIAVIIPPCESIDIENPDQIYTTEMISENSRDYTFIYKNIDKYGQYHVTLFSQDDNQRISQPQALTFTPLAHLPDSYESDNTWQTANIIPVNDQAPYHTIIPGYDWNQSHNFHTVDDEDWLMIYCVNDDTYTIKLSACNTCLSVNPIIELYAANDSESISPVENVHLSSDGLIFFVEFESEITGAHYIRISQCSSNTEINECKSISGPVTAYQIQVSQPKGTFAGFITGSVSPSYVKAIITTDGKGKAISTKNGSFFMPHISGNFIIKTMVEGFEPFEKSVFVKEIEPVTINIQLKSLYGVPTAQMSTNITSGNMPLIVNFLDESQGKISQWFWNFGDETTSDLRNPVHTFNKSGRFTISLTVTGPGGMHRNVFTDAVTVISEDSDGDGMDDNWEKQYGLDPFFNDAALDPDNDGLSNLEEYNNQCLPNNPSPDPPEFSIILTDVLEFKASPFIDKNPLDNHLYSQWQVSTDTNFSNFIIDIKSESMPLTSFTMPEFVLEGNNLYYIRCRYVDDKNGLSLWSEIKTYETPQTFIDENQNGIPDQSELNDSSIDLDGNGIPDINQSDIKNFRTSQKEWIGLTWDNNVNQLKTFYSVDDSEAIKIVNKPKHMPFGLIRFSLDVPITQNGQEIKVKLHLSDVIPTGSRYFVYDFFNGWQDAFSNIAFQEKSVEIKIQDGCFGDADQTINGIIVSSSGLVTRVNDSDMEDSDLGACFIDGLFKR